MRPTDILTAEHRVIEQVLDALEALARSSQENGWLDVARASTALEVLGTFADTCHHGKEEERLFPVLVARGMPKDVGPIAVMLDDHSAGRESIRRMRAACDSDDVDAFAREAQGYVALMREHIGKEDSVLFPMAESMLDEAARESLLESFRSFERDELGEDTHGRMLALADELARHYGVTPAAERVPAPATGCCGHRH